MTNYLHWRKRSITLHCFSCKSPWCPCLCQKLSSLTTMFWGKSLSKALRRYPHRNRDSYQRHIHFNSRFIALAVRFHILIEDSLKYKSAFCLMPFKQQQFQFHNKCSLHSTQDSQQFSLWELIWHSACTHKSCKHPVHWDSWYFLILE